MALGGVFAELEAQGKFIADAQEAPAQELELVEPPPAPELTVPPPPERATAQLG